MKKWSVLWVLAVFVLASLASAQQNLVKVNLQLKWFPQAQFAGFFVAKERGFFRAQGLDVTLLPAGDQSPIQVVQSGAADFGTTWIADLLTARERGIPVVHLAQIFQRSGFTLVALKSTGIKDLCKDLKGKSVGVWPSGNEYPAVALFRKCGLTSSLDPRVTNPDVTAVSYPFDPALVFPDKVQLVSAMIYNEVNQIAGLGYDETKVDVFKLADEGINLLEDLIFTTERVLNERNFKGSGLTGRQVAARLIRASIQGWNWAVANQAETVEKYVLPFCGNTCKAPAPAPMPRATRPGRWPRSPNSTTLGPPLRAGRVSWCLPTTSLGAPAARAGHPDQRPSGGHRGLWPLGSRHWQAGSRLEITWA